MSTLTPHEGPFLSAVMSGGHMACKVSQRVSTIPGFVSVGCGILCGKIFHPVFFFTICLFLLLSYDPTYDEDLILGS